MGLIPLMIYDDVAWLPYEGKDYSVTTYGFSGSIDMKDLTPHHTDITQSIRLIADMTDEEFTRKMNGLKKVRHSFTYKGVFEEVEAFLKDPFGPLGGHLRCTKHPKTMLCCG